jgi:hypothetical protein
MKMIERMKNDMRIKGVSMEMTSDRREWKKNTCCADPTLWDKGMMMMMNGGWQELDESSRRPSEMARI